MKVLNNRDKVIELRLANCKEQQFIDNTPEWLMPKSFLIESYDGLERKERDPNELVECGDVFGDKSFAYVELAKKKVNQFKQTPFDDYD